MNDWLVWQLVDSAYPGGGLAHSNGLEAARQAGLVTDARSLGAFIVATLRQTERAALPFLIATYRQPQELQVHDRAWDVQLNNHVTNRASRAQGQALVSSASRIFLNEGLVALARLARERTIAGHWATLFGAVMPQLGIGQADARQIFLFVTARAIVSSAVRLGIVGPLEGQSLQARVRCDDSDVDESDIPIAVQTTPILDLLQATQDRLYSRLFQS